MGDLYRMIQYSMERLGRKGKEREDDYYRCYFAVEWLLEQGVTNEPIDIAGLIFMQKN